jgi:hypothetical protein
MPLVISGATSGSATLQSTDTTTTTITLPAATCTLGITASTAQASTSGTSIDFTSIPSWVKRITIMFNGVSTNGINHWLVQLGSGSFTTTGYVSQSGQMVHNSTSTVINATAGMVIASTLSSTVCVGNMVLNSFGSNNWISSHSVGIDSSRACAGGGSIALSGTLDRIRITTLTGTDTFDAGSINILYE